MNFIVQPSQNQKLIAQHVGYSHELEEVERLNNFLQTFYMHGRQYVLKQVKLADFFNAEWLQAQMIDIFGMPWFWYNKMAQVYLLIQFTVQVWNFFCRILHGFNIRRAAPPQFGFIKVLYHGLTGTFTKSAYTFFYQNTEPLDTPSKENHKTTTISHETYTSDSSSSYGAENAPQHHTRPRHAKHHRSRSVGHHKSCRTNSSNSTSDDYITPVRSNYPPKEHAYEQVDGPRSSTPIYSPPPVHYDKLNHNINIHDMRNTNYHPMHRN